MNVYFITPACINIEAWKSLLKILKIETLASLQLYEPTKINPFNCYNDILKNIDVEYKINQILVDDLYNKKSEDQKARYKEVLRSIFKSIADIGTKKYRSYLGGDGWIEQKDEENVLVVFPRLQPNILVYCGQYFFNLIYKKNKNTSCRSFIDFIILDFIRQSSYRYSTSITGFKNTSYIYEIYSALESYNITEKELFDPNLYPKVINRRLKIAQRKQEEFERKWQQELEQEEASDISWGDAELRGMDESFPDWRWNID